MNQLTEEEKALCRDASFDEAICLRIRQFVSAPMERLWGIDEDHEEIEVDGVSVPGDEPVRDQLQMLLKPLGYLAFGYQKREPSGLRIPGRHVGIIQSSDPCDIVRLKGTDGCNYSIFNPDIIAKLEEWKQISEYEVVAADHDFVELVFSRLPENICRFAEEVFRLCPDTVHQGVGLMDIHNETEPLRAAEALCPELSDAIKNYDSVKDSHQRFLEQFPSEQRPAMEAQRREYMEGILPLFQALMEIANELPHPSQEQGIKLLALSIQTSRRLHLWWD